MTVTFLQTIHFVGENGLRWIYGWEFRFIGGKLDL